MSLEIQKALLAVNAMRTRGVVRISRCPMSGWRRTRNESYDRAESLFRSSLACLPERFPLLELAKLMNSLGSCLMKLRRADEAADLYFQVVKIRTQALGENDESTHRALMNLIAAKSS